MDALPDHLTPRGPRILFVSSTTIGGSGRSQRELDRAVRAAGAETMMLVDDGEGHSVSRFLHEQLWDASVRFTETPVISSSARWLRSLPGRNARPVDASEGDVLVTHAPENAFPDLAVDFEPDVVVGSSIAGPTWRAIRETCRELGVPTVLYLREETALRHLHPGYGDHDLILANSRTLVDKARGRGAHAHFVPSVIDLTNARCTPSRDVIMLVNPRESHGVDLVPELARTFPTSPFVLQESWPLDEEERAVVDSLLEAHPNVEFRPYDPEPASMFADVGLLLAPHRIDNRPRTVLEAQVNGIPVIASSLPGLVEAVGPGGVCLSTDRPVLWTDAIAEIWTNPTRYRQLEDAARGHAGRDEVDPDRIIARFLELIDDVIGRYRDTGAGMSPVQL